MPRVEAIDLSSMPESIAEKIGSYCIKLENLDFKRVGYFELPDFMPNVLCRLSLLLNAVDKTWAMVAVLKSKHQEICYVEFCTEFFDGMEICTSNSSQLQGFIKTPCKKVFQFPMLIKNIDALYEAHNYLKNLHFGNKNITINGIGKERKYLESNLTKDFAQQAELGFYYLNCENTKYRPTWKGAILMTWKQIWPIGLIQRIILRKKAERILQINTNIQNC